MPRFSCSTWILIGVVLLILFAIGFLFPVPLPEVHLEAEPLPGLPTFITNTFLASLLTILVLLLIFLPVTLKPRLIPGRWQAAVEWVLDWILGLCEEVSGRKYGRLFFPIVATIFLYIVVAALLSLIPGFEVIGFGHPAPAEGIPGAFVGAYHGFVVDIPLLRKANTDINFPLALALASFIFVEIMGVRALGFFRYAGRFISLGEFLRGFGRLLKGRLRQGFSMLFFGLIESFVGLIELISEFIRVVSLTFRLFGNMTAGMILLLLICYLVPWVVGSVFYGLEALFGFVQALIFAGLTLAFAQIAVTPREIHG